MGARCKAVKRLSLIHILPHFAHEPGCAGHRVHDAVRAYRDGTGGHYAEKGERHHPVSYTHLDVYKRQAVPRAAHLRRPNAVI